jgi:anti-sigma B factor antagonist
VGATDDGTNRADAAVLELHGELDVATADDIRARAADLLTGSVEELTIDLADVSFIDSTAIGALLDVKVMSERAGVRMRLGNVPLGVSRIITISGLADTLGLQ